ncbi:RHS repeat-associated core domain-containing protein [Pseudomonas putida]|uniref:RHS repeat-associated core domain-containing protein n=1 Tax=Pseudomonas putida TaxID=303 RepID=UPI0009BC8AA7|nr:RHS repeat-associated core domain-containing protein [Pseudomonas putida]
MSDINPSGESDRNRAVTLPLFIGQRSDVSAARVQASIGHIAYDLYGVPSSEQVIRCHLRFNGELREPALTAYALGAGNRLYNAILMRFYTPDPESPMEAGGLNSYAYCGGDPLNRIDPDGHAFVLMGSLRALVQRTARFWQGGTISSNLGANAPSAVVNLSRAEPGTSARVSALRVTAAHDTIKPSTRTYKISRLPTEEAQANVLPGVVEHKQSAHEAQPLGSVKSRLWLSWSVPRPAVPPVRSRSVFADGGADRITRMSRNLRTIMYWNRRHAGDAAKVRGKP